MGVDLTIILGLASAGAAHAPALVFHPIIIIPVIGV